MLGDQAHSRGFLDFIFHLLDYHLVYTLTDPSRMQITWRFFFKGTLVRFHSL